MKKIYVTFELELERFTGEQVLATSPALGDGSGTMTDVYEDL